MCKRFGGRRRSDKVSGAASTHPALPPLAFPPPKYVALWRSTDAHHHTNQRSKDDEQPALFLCPRTYNMLHPLILLELHISQHRFCGCFDGSCDRAEPFQDAFFGVPSRAPNEPWVSRRRGHDLSGDGGERGRRIGRSYMPASVGRALPAMGPTSSPLDEPVRPTGVLFGT